MPTLHAHSTYSFLQGTVAYNELVSLAKKDGSSFVSLTDFNGMYGLIQFAKAAEEEKLKPILGVLIDDPKDDKLNTLLIAKNNEGYSQLCKIITSRKLKDDFSLVNLLDDDLSNLFIISSSLELIELTKNRLKKIPNFFVELIVTEKLKKKTRELYDIAKQNKLKFIASHPLPDTIAILFVIFTPKS